MYLLDTNVVSELRKGSRADFNVRSWADSIDMKELFISVISVMEIRIGILNLSRKDINQANILTRWLDNSVIPTFDERILAIDIHIANKCAALHVPDPRSERDALIAATALIHGMTVVTRNVKDFQSITTNIINPWDIGITPSVTI